MSKQTSVRPADDREENGGEAPERKVYAYMNVRNKVN